MITIFASVEQMQEALSWTMHTQDASQSFHD